MRVSVMVLGDPVRSRAPDFAVRVLEAALAAGHTLDTAFFYHTGAYAALNPAGLGPRWLRLAEVGLRCVVCRSAWEALGEPQAPTEPFTLGGLVDWLAAAERSERLLRFGSAE